MRILQMIDDLRVGGGQKVAAQMAREANRRGHSTAILYLNTYPGVTIEPELRTEGVPVIAIPARRLLDPVRFVRLVRRLRRERFDVIQTHLTYANILGSLAGRLAGTPVVGTLHSTVEDPKHRNPIREALETFALRYAAQRVLAVGSRVEAAHRTRLGASQLVMIPNAVAEPPLMPPAERRALRDRLDLDPNALLILSVGRLVQPKGYEDLISAMALLRPRFPSAQLLIAGEGDLRAALEAHIDALGVGDRVMLLGTRQDVPQLLRIADLYVCSSVWEGLPLTILEAMMAGVPVVATRVGDIPDVIAPEYGALAPPGAPALLAEAIARYLADPEARQSAGQAAHTYAVRQYDIATWAERMLALFQSIASKSGRVA